MKQKLKYEDVITAIETTNGDLIAACNILCAKYSTVYAFVKRYNLKFKSKKPSLVCSKEQLEKSYNRLGSLSLVAQEFGGTKEGIRSAMKRYGLRIKKPIIHTVNDCFFSEYNEKSFYWAGFIAADGCVKTRLNKTEVNYLDIGLSKNDKDHLLLFKSQINTTAPVSDYIIKNSKRNSEWNDVWKSEIKITSLQICNDLKRFNIVPRKSKIYTFPEWLINHELVSHFMRGYFDGDGSFFISKPKNGRTIEQLYFSLRGTQDFLKVYRSILESKCGLKVRDQDIRTNSGIGVLEYGGNGILEKIVEFLYKDAQVYLPRKYDIAKTILTP